VRTNDPLPAHGERVPQAGEGPSGCDGTPPSSACGTFSPDERGRRELLAAARGERVLVDGDALVREAAAEGMLGLLGRAAANPHRELQMKAAAVEAHGVFMLAELTRISAAFEKTGVPLLAFKGPVLSQQLYGHPGLRSFSDLDVIVAPRDAGEAEALLQTLGYRSTISGAERQTNRRYAGEEHFTNEANGVLVDFHTLFSNQQFPVRLSFDDVWSRRVNVLGVPAFGDADLVVLTCSHAAKHLWHKLEYLAQIAALARKSIDWDEVDRIAIDARAARQVGLSFLLARDILGIAVPELRCIEAAKPYLETARTLVGTAHDATGRDHFLLLDRRRDAIRSIALSVFIPTHDDWQSPLPWLYRPLRLFRKLLRRGAPGSRDARAGTSPDY